MRLLTLRYAATCDNCGADLPTGSQAGYERGCGTYCPEHTPTDPEAIRVLRQARNDRKAARRDEWAAARQRRADALQGRSDALMGGRDSEGRLDWAIVTQPGHIPARARAIRAQERAWDEHRAAGEHRGKAAALRAPVAVAGDKAKKREEINQKARAYLLDKGFKVGVYTLNGFYGRARVVRLNHKSVSIETSSGWRTLCRWDDCLNWATEEAALPAR